MNYDWWVGGKDLGGMGEGYYIQKKIVLKNLFSIKNQWPQTSEYLGNTNNTP